MDQREILVPESLDPKEVYAFFGLAAYYAQVLEQELLIFAVMLHLSGQTSITGRRVERLFVELETRTFGQLITEARKLTTVPADVETRLTEALQKRNFLIHQFFASHAEDFMSEAGRSRMIEELREALALFEHAEQAVTAIREPLSTKLGITAERTKQEVDRMLASAAARDYG